MRFANLLKLTLASAILSSTIAVPVFAQNYHYNYGSSRVVNQGGLGIYRPESTYIPTGAINATAKGRQSGGVNQLANPLLPKVPWGANINTPGDNFYMGGAPSTPDAALPSYVQPVGQAPRRPTRQPVMRQVQRPPGTLYVPGQNAHGGGYSSGGGTYSYSSGAATYDDTSPIGGE